ncbi:hypothetical protein Taro_034243 [Colocasia esculenta]|uniref:Uncharacterized protein n=1 Tax=Colocasia esculenta TaxID=4460 RepID=A0A843W093_COLES|nr:hypothetical protein [Colocasia esculenta]
MRHIDGRRAIVHGIQVSYINSLTPIVQVFPTLVAPAAAVGLLLLELHSSTTVVAVLLSLPRGAATTTLRWLLRLTLRLSTDGDHLSTYLKLTSSCRQITLFCRQMDWPIDSQPWLVDRVFANPFLEVDLAAADRWGSLVDRPQASRTPKLQKISVVVDRWTGLSTTNPSLSTGGIWSCRQVFLVVVVHVGSIGSIDKTIVRSIM